MQPIEKALKMVFEHLGNQYGLPQGEYLQSDFDEVVQVKNPYYLQTAKNVKFSFGTEKELNIWLKSKNEKYPLAWLVYPVSESSDNSPKKLYEYKGLRIIFAVNNDSDKLVQTRIQTTRFILDQIVERFCGLMTSGLFKKFIWMDLKNQHTQKFFPNYSVNNQKDSAVIDIWDAITLDCTLYLKPACMPDNLLQLKNQRK